MHTHRIAAVTALIALSATLDSQAAPITWGSPQTIIGDSDVSLTGSLVFAYNFNGANTTVNSVLFQQNLRLDDYGDAGSALPPFTDL